MKSSNIILMSLSKLSLFFNHFFPHLISEHLWINERELSELKFATICVSALYIINT